MKHETLEELAKSRKVHIHEPFAKFLHADASMHSFDISLLDCYRLAGHACHAITGAFLSAEKAIELLFPETKTCLRGDIAIEFGSALNERATGPRSNVMSYITGGWAESGFPGLQGNFKRKNLVSYGNSNVGERAIRFRRLSNGQSVVIEYDPSRVIDALRSQAEFPEKWREEILAILNDSNQAVRVLE